MSFQEFRLFLKEYTLSFFPQKPLTPRERIFKLGSLRRNPYWRFYFAVHDWIGIGRYFIHHSIFYTLPSLVWKHTFGRWIYVKHGLNGHKIEYNNLKFLHDHSHELRIPVPRPYFSLVFQHRLWPYHGEYLFMTRLHGHDLHHQWLNLSHSEKYKIVSQLRSYMLNLRSMKAPPGTMIGSFHGGPVGCYRLLDFDVVGPFLDEPHFNRHLRGPLAPSSLSSAVLNSHQKRHDLCATHNDLFPRNILVDADLNVTGVVDWKSSGWFPAHWEYCMCRNWAYDEVDKDWKNWIHEFLDSWAEEEIADHDLLRAYPNQMVYWSTRLNIDSEDGYELYYHTHD